MTPLLDTLELTRHLNIYSVVNQCIEKSVKIDVLDLLPAGKKKKKAILERKAIAKYKTVESMLKLIDIHSYFEKMYWDTYHCCETIEQQGQYITAHYCSKRWCQVCNRIVEQKLFDAYGPVLQNFQNPMFVTLSIVNVSKPELSTAIKRMVRTFIKINHLFRHLRPYRIVGIRKIEVEPSVHRGEYHPHFHIIMENECGAAEALVQEWLKAYPTADKRGQNITKCIGEGALRELFKYATKPAVKNKSKKGSKENHTAYQLDTIYQALDKKRIFQPIGIKKASVSENVEGIRSQKIPDLRNLPFKELDMWYWNQYEKDWINIAGDHLSRYRMNKEIPGFVPIPGYCHRN